MAFHLSYLNFLTWFKYGAFPDRIILQNLQEMKIKTNK